MVPIHWYVLYMYLEMQSQCKQNPNKTANFFLFSLFRFVVFFFFFFVQVWIRPGQRNKVDDIYATRAYVNVLERAVAASLQHSNGRVGKFNVILDGQGFSWNLMPSIHQLKVFITILQDHFPDRLGIVLLSNLGRIGEFVVNIIKPLISEEVRQKLKILPRDLKQRRVMLQTIVGPKYIPTWLGGKDSFVFDVDTYYSQTKVLSDTEAVDYVQSMPYHS